jgi:hypothetical protein
MSSSRNHEKNDQQPPSKRQRILPEGTRGTCASSVSVSGSAESRLMSPPPRLGKTTGASYSYSSVVSIRPPTDSGPIFTDVQEIDGYNCSSIESALGVPTRILFRQVGGDRKEEEGASNANISSGKKKKKRRLRPLLSRQEAEQFLRLTLLAQEIDILVDLSETVLSRRQFARRFRREVLMQSDAKSAPASSNDRPWRNPWLATLGPILDVLEQRQSNPSRQYCQLHNNFVSNQQQNPQEDILHHIHNELARLYHGLQTCGVYELERSAEQNRSLVASLTDILGFDDDGQGDANDSGRTSAVRKLAREKHSLSKLQDLLAKRVRSLLLVLCHSRTATTAESNATSDDRAKIDVDVDNDNNNENDRKQIMFDEQLSSTSTDANTDNIDNGNNPSTKKKASNEKDNDDEDKASDDDESSVLSLEEILIPLEIICEKLFARADRKTTATTMAKIQNENDSVSENRCDKLEIEEISGFIEPTAEGKQQQIHKEKKGLHPTNNDSSLLKAAAKMSVTTTGNATATVPGSTAEDSDPMTRIPLEFSQRTVGAAATIMALAGIAEQEYTAPKKVTIQPGSGEEDSDPMTMLTAEASQKTIGAADTMMALAMKAGKDFPTHKTITAKRNPIHKSQNNRNSKVDIVDMTNRDSPHMQQFPGNDDDSFADDPPSDGEDGYVETTNKEKAGGCKDNATCNLGIFDVVDVLTPQSQSQQS